MITQKYLKQLFDYDGENLIWKENRGIAKIGTIAGTVNSRGYRHIRIDNKFYQAHRLIWIYVYGFLNDFDLIDHIDRNRVNNKISNLRKCSNIENNLNRKVSSNSSSGIKNIYKTKSGLYYVECGLNGKQYRTPKFKTVNEAVAVRNEFVRNIHRDFSS
jgi:hypothetical protein